MSGIVGGAGSKSGVIGTTELEYETGSWTPIIRDATANYATLSTELGTYVKVGKMLVCSYDWVMTSKGSMAGSYIIMADMPFDHPAGQSGTGMVDKFNGFNASWSWLAWDIKGAGLGTKIYLTASAAAGTDEMVFVPPSPSLSGNEKMQGGLFYFVA